MSMETLKSKKEKANKQNSRLRFKSKDEYEQTLNELIGFDERHYLNVY